MIIFDIYINLGVTAVYTADFHSSKLKIKIIFYTT